MTTRDDVHDVHDVRDGLIDRRAAIRRVSALLGDITLVGGSGLLTACERARSSGADSGAAAGGAIGDFTAEDVALLDEIADTMLPETTTPGAKAAHTGAFMALMVTDSYHPDDQKTFRDGLRTVDEACRAAHDVAFVQATPQQRLALVERLDREQKAHMDARAAARSARDARSAAAAQADTATQGDAFLPDQRSENAPGPDASAAPAITADAPTHYFRMMKELALLGYFTSEIGCKQAQRYVESPGRFDPCVPYAPGERSWAPHA